MGGGDLNLKKSWHPSTMRNMEKVWKAEQKHDQEKKRIAELQREIQAEKAREDMKKYAEDQGVIEKKSGDVKLDWMYKGPGTTVDHEEYLLGKAIDKSFEQLQRSQLQNSAAICVPGRTDTCLPGSIFAGSGEQVDVARKLQEDPLLAIRKKELESRSQILKNPVKLKQLKEMIKKQKSKKGHSKHKKEKKKKKSKKRSKHSSSSEDSESDLDAKLLAKYQKLKEKLGDNPLAILQKSSSSYVIQDDKKHRRNRTSSSESDTESKKKHKKRSKSTSESESEDEEKRTKKCKSSSESEDEDQRHKKNRKSYGLLLPNGSKVEKTTSRMPTSVEKQDRDKPKTETLQKPQVQHRQKLSDEEKERRRQEMLANAAWREQDREDNVARYREADRRTEKTQSRGEFGDFIRKQLSHAASESSVASRIKSNINNIQRSGGSMDRNFARR